MELIETIMLPLAAIETNAGQVEGLPANPRQIKDDKYKKLVASIAENPEMLALRELLVYEYKKGKYVTIGGNMRREALKELKYKEAPCKVIPKTATIEQLKAYTIKDNSGFGEWDWDLLGNEWDDMPLAEWGVNMPFNNEGEGEEDEIERKRREFKERMAAGEISEEDEEYQEFVAKFETKKTTDDCYTPDVVYDAVARWVMDEYKVERKDFERPFYPGGDYQKHIYPEGCVVVDNPPFSILAEILDFYTGRGIKFFLFCPTLTLFSSSSSRNSCAIPVGASVTYENGANVNTSFLTNLESPELRVRSAPSLYRVIKEANDENLKALHKSLPKYEYPHNVITSARVAYLSHYGEDFRLNVKESQPIDQLDAQREAGKSVYGKGYLIGNQAAAEKAAAEKAAAEKAAAEKAAAEKAAATCWALSDREKEIIKKLSK